MNTQSSNCERSTVFDDPVIADFVDEVKRRCSVDFRSNPSAFKQLIAESSSCSCSEAEDVALISEFGFENETRNATLADKIHDLVHAKGKAVGGFQVSALSAIDKLMSAARDELSGEPLESFNASAQTFRRDLLDQIQQHQFSERTPRKPNEQRSRNIFWAGLMRIWVVYLKRELTITTNPIDNTASGDLVEFISLCSEDLIEPRHLTRQAIRSFVRRKKEVVERIVSLEADSQRCLERRRIQSGRTRKDGDDLRRAPGSATHSAEFNAAGPNDQRHAEFYMRIQSELEWRIEFDEICSKLSLAYWEL